MEVWCLLHLELGALHRHKGYRRVCPWMTVVSSGARTDYTGMTVDVIRLKDTRLSERAHAKLQDDASLRREV